MAYIRSKKISGKNDKIYTYYQLVRGYREDGKVKQEVLAHLGSNDTPEGAIEEWERRAQWARAHAGDYAHGAEYIRTGRADAPYNFRGQRHKRLLPQRSTPLDSDPPARGSYASRGWYYSAGFAEDLEAEAQKYITEAEHFERKAAQLRSLL